MGHWNFDDHLTGWNNHFYDQIFKEIQSNKEGYFKCRFVWRRNSKYGKKHIKKVRGS